MGLSAVKRTRNPAGNSLTMLAECTVTALAGAAAASCTTARAETTARTMAADTTRLGWIPLTIMRERGS